MYICGRCKVHACDLENPEFPKVCPCRDEEIVQKSLEIANEPDNKELGIASSYARGEDNKRHTRIEETMNVLKHLGVKHVGFAFCTGLSKEAEVFQKILEHNGFEVDSVICRCGNLPREAIGIPDDRKVNPGHFETMCNPIGQALFLEKCKTEFNIMMGLCVGHDALFFKYTHVPCTVIAVKDKVLAHNPLGAIYNIETYYKEMLK